MLNILLIINKDSSKLFSVSFKCNLSNSSCNSINISVILIDFLYSYVTLFSLFSPLNGKTIFFLLKINDFISNSNRKNILKYNISSSFSGMKLSLYSLLVILLNMALFNVNN